jgi:hypothetical protein
MKHRNSHLLIGYWSRIRRGREVPDQADLDPRAMKRVLSHVFILDTRDAARPAYRLAGTSLCERFGEELRGTGFFAHWEAQARDKIALLLRQSLMMKQPVCLSAIGVTSQCSTIEMETVLAPLTFGPGAPRRFLGIVQFLGDTSPLGGFPIVYERLIGSKMICENDPIAPLSDPPPPPPPTPFASGGTHRAQHLRLVISRDKPATLHSEMDDSIGRMIAALDVVPGISLMR